MHLGRFVLACAVAAGVILSAPYVSEVRRWIRAQFPGRFVLVVGGAIALVIGTALLVTLIRIRERRALRYGALAAALALGASYSLAFADGRPEVDVVERFHFIEFGLITLLFYRAWRPLDDASIFVLPLLAGLAVGTIEEWFQWFIPVRVGDMRDIFLNGVAIVCGLLFSVAVDPPARVGLAFRPGSVRRIGAVAAVVVVLISGFFHIVRLGHEIRDDEIGTFWSRYTAQELAELSAARAAQWREMPPPLTVPRLYREDQYLTEGIEHVMERNELWDTGNAAGAWLENRILEKYYAPVLSTPSYHAKAGSRWPDEQRHNAEVAAKLSAGGAIEQAPYASASNPASIYTWPKRTYWMVVGAVAVFLAAVTAAVDRRRSGTSGTRATAAL